jgi:hypothetical protein
MIDSVTRKLNKISPNVWKKWPNISISKLNLKAQKIHIQQLLKPWVEIACLGENWLSKK